MKLVPSELSDGGTASFAPLELTTADSFTSEPKALIKPETDESVASPSGICRKGGYTD